MRQNQYKCSSKEIRNYGCNALWVDRKLLEVLSTWISFQLCQHPQHLRLHNFCAPCHPCPCSLHQSVTLSLSLTDTRVQKCRDCKHWRPFHVLRINQNVCKFRTNRVKPEYKYMAPAHVCTNFSNIQNLKMNSCFEAANPRSRHHYLLNSEYPTVH